MEILRSLVIHYPGVMEFIEPTEVHGHLIIQSHQL